MVKKALIDIALNSSIFFTDFSQNWDAYEILIKAKRNPETIDALEEHDEYQ